jgi:hypothetical protein
MSHEQTQPQKMLLMHGRYIPVEGGQTPLRATIGSTGFDCFARVDTDPRRTDNAVLRIDPGGRLVVPLGFDASEFEPLAALNVTADGFARAGAAIGALRLPTAICQEGGYNVDILGALLQRFLTGFGDAA